MPTVEDQIEAKLDQRGRERLADALGLPMLNDEYAKLIEYLLAAYHRQRHGNSDTTVGNTLAAIKELIKAIERAIRTSAPCDRTKAQKLMERVRDGRSGLAYEARDRLLSCGETPGGVLAQAYDLLAFYKAHPRIDPESEPFRHLCGVLSRVFDGIAVSASDDVRHDKLRRRRFALAVFDIAGIETPNFVAHPERLDELLSTVVSLISVGLVSGDPNADRFVPSMERFQGEDRV